MSADALKPFREAVKDAANFYRDVLGLRVDRHDANFIQFATEGTRLYLHRSADAIPL